MLNKRRKSRKTSLPQRKGLSEDDYYLDNNGFTVFTEAYHLKRGYCCKNGCRHCPYGFTLRLGPGAKNSGKE